MTVRPSVRHALRHWTALKPIVQDAKVLFLLTDYDGTLTSIVATPEQARLSVRIKSALRAVAKLHGVRVGIVSGRSLRVVRRLVQIPGLLYVGNHGYEISGPGLRFTHPGAKRVEAVLARLARQLRTALRPIRGSRVEAKGLSLSIHWRQVAARDVPRFRRIVQRALRAWVAAGRVRVTQGKRVVEVRPPMAWDKGRSIEWIVRHADRPRQVTVLYLGDDRTDEDAFRVVNRLRGVSIFIGMRHRTTAARWRLTSPREVSELLERIFEARDRHVRTSEWKRRTSSRGRWAEGITKAGSR